jgi:DNA-binding transcriptional MerR regulator
MIFNGNRRYYDDETINILKKIKFLLKDKGMTLNGVKKALNSDDSDIDELYNTTIRQRQFIRSKINNIKNILTTIKKK